MTAPAKNTTNSQYVHGYNQREALRLEDQAKTLTQMLHWDTSYPDGSYVLEAGCGVGAQTLTLAKNSPQARFLSIDISYESLKQARHTIKTAGINNVRFEQADIFALPYAENEFDHIFVCFVLEHLPAPAKMLKTLKNFLKPGGTITLIEGDHGSAFFHPPSNQAQQAINAQITLQQQAGGNALIGRQLFPLLEHAGFGEIKVSPRFVYADGATPHMAKGFTEKTFTAMIEGIKQRAIEAKILTQEEFDEGIKGLKRTAEQDGVFCYTFFKATAVKTAQ